MKADDQLVWQTICLIALIILVSFLAYETMKSGSRAEKLDPSKFQDCRCICEPPTKGVDHDRREDPGRY